MSIRRQPRTKKSYLLPLDENGMPIIPLDDDGKPDLGRLIRYTRKHINKWSAEKLGKLYGEKIDGRPVTARWIQSMEKNNDIPVDPKRRLILATLLGISPFLFGLSEEFIRSQEISSSQNLSHKEKSIDLKDYDSTLRSYWKLYYANTVHDNILDIKRRINNLENLILYTSTNQKRTMQRTLCNYLILIANMARDQKEYEIAISYLNNAAILAKENEHNDLYAAALYRRGYVYFDMWDIFRNSEYLARSIKNYEAAKKLDRYVGSSLKGSILLEGGHAYAHTVLTNQDKNQSLKMLDQGGKIVQQSNFEQLEDIEYFLKLSEYVYHNDKASAFLAFGWYNTAYDELLLVKEGIAPGFKRRNAYHNILLARTFSGQKLYPIATAAIEDALSTIKSIKSSVHLARIAKIYRGLKESSFGKSTEVASLGVELMKAQNQRLFR